MQIRKRTEANYFFHLMLFVFSIMLMKKMISRIQFDVIMTSLPVDVLVNKETSPEQRRIILLQTYKILERFLDK